MCVSVLLLTATVTRTGSDARTVAVTVFENRSATFIATFRNILNTKVKDIADVLIFFFKSFLQKTFRYALVRK